MQICLHQISNLRSKLPIPFWKLVSGRLQCVPRPGTPGLRYLGRHLQPRSDVDIIEVRVVCEGRVGDGLSCESSACLGALQGHHSKLESSWDERQDLNRADRGARSWRSEAIVRMLCSQSRQRSTQHADVCTTSVILLLPKPSCPGGYMSRMLMICAGTAFAACRGCSWEWLGD